MHVFNVQNLLFRFSNPLKNDLAFRQFFLFKKSNFQLEAHWSAVRF